MNIDTTLAHHFHNNIRADGGKGGVTTLYPERSAPNHGLKSPQEAPDVKALVLDLFFADDTTGILSDTCPQSNLVLAPSRTPPALDGTQNKTSNDGSDHSHRERKLIGFPKQSYSSGTNAAHLSLRGVQQSTHQLLQNQGARDIRRPGLPDPELSEGALQTEA